VIDEFVFPQDFRMGEDEQRGQPAYNIREGGLTKRELFAAIFFTDKTTASSAVQKADLLLEVLDASGEKR